MQREKKNFTLLFGRKKCYRDFGCISYFSRFFRKRYLCAFFAIREYHSTNIKVVYLLYDLFPYIYLCIYKMRIYNK